MKFIRKRVMVLFGVIAVAVAIAVPVALAWSTTGNLTDADKKMLGRLTRDGVPSTCPGKANPGLFTNSGIRSYDVYRHRNTSGHPVCIDVDLTVHNPSTCGVNAFAQANSPFSALNPSAHYLGDAGSSDSVQSFSFTVGPGQSFDVVVGQVNPHSSCQYTLTVEPAV
jgi:hypothetical protein